MYEIDAFTPIINLPECAILGVGRIVPKQVVVDAEAERVAIRHMMFLSLTFDHRLVDGAPAARFLQRVKQYVEKPYLWLVGNGRRMLTSRNVSCARSTTKNPTACRSSSARPARRRCWRPATSGSRPTWASRARRRSSGAACSTS